MLNECVTQSLLSKTSVVVFDTVFFFSKRIEWLNLATCMIIASDVRFVHNLDVRAVGSTDTSLRNVVDCENEFDCLRYRRIAEDDKRDHVQDHGPSQVPPPSQGDDGTVIDFFFFTPRVLFFFFLKTT